MGNFTWSRKISWFDNQKVVKKSRVKKDKVVKKTAVSKSMQGKKRK
jgi:hypothetical protein